MSLIALTLIASTLSAQQAAPTEQVETDIIVTAPKTVSERQREVRKQAKAIIRPPRRKRPVARFFHPICPQAAGLAPPDAEAIEERIRENARALGVAASASPDCEPTIKVAFMAPAAGSSETWLDDTSSSIAHLTSKQRERVLLESGPVRAWNKVMVRDYNGQPIRQGGADGRVDVSYEIPTIDPPPPSRSTPLVTAEITGAAVLIERDAAAGFTLAQLADYATMRTLLGTREPKKDEVLAAPTILTLFQTPSPPAALTNFDRALVGELYNASRNSSARRVYNDIAKAAVEADADK